MMVLLDQEINKYIQYEIVHPIRFRKPNFIPIYIESSALTPSIDNKFDLNKEFIYERS